jgi:hypothetical protein
MLMSRSVTTAAALTAAELTISNTLVHKSRTSEVLLTGLRRDGAGQYQITARWPRNHRFYPVHRNLHDPLLLIETIRQTFPLLSHAAFGTPLGHHLVWEHFSYGILTDVLRTSSGQHSDDQVELDIDCQEVVRRGNRVAALALDYVVRRDGEPLATAQTRFTIQAPPVYQRLRASRGDAATMMARSIPLTAPIPEQVACRASAADVVLSPTEQPHRWQLRVDTAHPFLFDHPVDHVPGALLLDAARQAAQASSPAPRLAVAMECEFSRYVELDQPCWVEVAPLPRDAARRTRLCVTMRQSDGPPSCSTVVTLLPHPSDL